LGESPGTGHSTRSFLIAAIVAWNFYSYVMSYIWEQKPIQVIAVSTGLVTSLGSSSPA